MTEIGRWPDSSDLSCGCRVSLKLEGEIDLLMYFPCSHGCENLREVQNHAIDSGKPWQVRKSIDN